LLTAYRFNVNGKIIAKSFVGGLLGHWSVWTGAAVKLVSRIKQAVANNNDMGEQLSVGVKATDANAAISDAANDFRECIAGIHEVLRRQGLMEGIWCLNADETLSPGQLEEIDRVCNAYPELTDDEAVRNFLKGALSHQY